MKLSLRAKLSAGLVLFTALVTATSTVAWFLPKFALAKTDNEIEGTTIGAYYASGNGLTPETAFLITKPRHLYNLAWLQYLGTYNRPAENGKQYYFKLGADIDMSEWVLPPIGTENNPFIGHFDGQDYIVSGLTVSNDFTQLEKHPSVVTSSNFEQPHILGFFGVIGDYNDDYSGSGSVYSSSTNQFVNTGLTGITIDTVTQDSLVGLAAGYVDGTMSDIAVDTGTIDIEHASSTAYGDFDNISDYTLIGYTTKKTSIKKVTDTIYDIDVQTGMEFNGNAQGAEQGWGGSINMKSMFERINNVRTNSGNNGATASLKNRSTSYQYRTTTTYNADGSVRSTTPSTKTSNSLILRGAGANATIGNFTFVNSNSSSYMYLGGGERKINDYYSYYTHTGRYITDGTNYLYYNGTNLTNATNTTTATLWVFTVTSGTTYTITTTYNGTTYYLYNNNGTLAIATNPSSTNRSWNITQSSNKFDIVNGLYKIYYYSNEWKLIPTTNDTYYVMQSGSNYISSSSTNGSTPTNTTSEASAAHFYRESNTNYFYFYSNNNTSGTKLYLMQYYRNNRTPALYVRTGSANYYYYYTFNGTTLSSTANNTQYYVRYNNGWTYTTTQDQRITPTSKTVDYVSMKLSNTLSESQTTKNGPDNYLDESRRESSYEYTAANTTYFPLNVTADGGSTASFITNGNYRPTEANTGYVVAGTNVPESTAIEDGGPSLVRVSQYSKTHNVNNRSQTIKNSFKYSDSYANGTIADSDVKTISSSGHVSLTTAYPNPEKSLEKYASSKTSLLNILRSSSYNFGLHFMNTQVSSSHLVEATNVSILGESYGNPNDTNTNKRTYEMPVNAIDFNLKEKGYINFFAGTYFSSDVTSFFSIHQIFRDGEANGYKISEIKEIAKIYGNPDHKNYSYAYKYTDGTYSKPYRFTGIEDKFELSNANPDPNTAYVESHALTSTQFQTYIDDFDYVELFDTEWIANYSHTTHEKIYDLSQEYLYYFEIPMNNGEFCLGSVYGGAGGYLLYLDIGASAAKTQRTMVAEHFLEEIYSFSHPDGVALIPTNSIAGQNPTFNAANSVCAIIEEAYKGKVVVARDNSNHVTISRATGSTDYIKPSYISDTIVSVVDPGATSATSDDTDLTKSFKYESKVEKETYRIQYFDYNVNYETLTKTIIEDTRTRTNDGNWTGLSRKITQQVGDGAVLTLTSASQITNAEIIIFKYLGTNNANNGLPWDYSDITNTTSTIYFNGTSAVTSSTIGVTLDDEILILYHILEGDTTVEKTIQLELETDDDVPDGVYYKYGEYIFIPVVTGGSVTFIVKDIGSQTVYFVDGNVVWDEEEQKFVYTIPTDLTELTTVDQEVTAQP